MTNFTSPIMHNPIPREEVTNPTRTVTSIVRVEGGNLAAVSVKTKEVIPKAKIFVSCINKAAEM